MWWAGPIATAHYLADRDLPGRSVSRCDQSALEGSFCRVGTRPAREPASDPAGSWWAGPPSTKQNQAFPTWLNPPGQRPVPASGTGVVDDPEQNQSGQQHVPEVILAEPRTWTKVPLRLFKSSRMNLPSLR